MKKKGKIKYVIVSALMLGALTTPIMPVHSVKAETMQDSVEPKGIFTSLSLYMEVGNGQVSSVCKNQLTIFPAEVKVYIELYCSDTYQESYTTMNLVEMIYTPDLNMGSTISATGNINGQTKYWQGRVRYRIDSNAWEARNTGTICVDGNGNIIE